MGRNMFGNYQAGPQAMFSKFQPYQPGNFFQRLFGKRTGPTVQQVSPFHFGPRPVQTNLPFMQRINPQNISQFLKQTRQVLHAAQQITPMIQQYGSLIRNLPALFKLYRDMKVQSNENDEEKKENQEEETKKNEEDPPADKETKQKTEKKQKKKRKKNLESKPSVPKLYI